jgi:hypothetical protein
MLVPARWMGCGHLHFLRKSKERLAHLKHPIDHFLWETGIDEIYKSDIPTCIIEILADSLG